jgi:NDP-sugar pyrophosphorylase family protein
MVAHQLLAVSRLPNVKDIQMLGFYPSSVIAPYIPTLQAYCSVKIEYLEESGEMGTAGGIALHLDSVFSPEMYTMRCTTCSSAHVLVMHADICSDFPLETFLAFHEGKSCSIMTIQLP